LCALVAVFLLSLVTACEREKSSTPLSPSIAGPIAGVTIDAPKPVAPASSAQISMDQQPVTLTVENAATNGVRSLSYVFEIGTDAALSAKLFSQTGVPPGPDGRTSLRLPQNLTADRTYYWRAKADDGANASDFSTPISFRVYTPVVIQAPVLSAPADGATLTSRRPTLAVTNAQRSGPAGTIKYLFEVATDAAFASKAISVLVTESASGQTSYNGTDDLAYATRYYWRSKASDSSHESPYSSIRNFLTPAAPVTPAPTPSPAPSTGGPVDSRIAGAPFLNNPPDIASWAQTARMTSIDFNGDSFSFDFDKRDGPGKWPEVQFGSDGSLQYTVGMCLNINGQWYCSAALQYWDGRDPSATAQIARDWFYDPIRWGPLAGHQPAPGELVAIFVVQGNVRGANSSNRERSDFVFMPFGGHYRGQ
jgi:hypothetical protein